MRLKRVCSSLGVDVVEGEAFLSRGAFRRVFKLTRQGQEFALKIAEDCSTDRLHQDKEALTKAQHTGLAISPVKSVETPDVIAVFLLGSAKGLLHGDPRVANVIIAGGSCSGLTL